MGTFEIACYSLLFRFFFFPSVHMYNVEPLNRCRGLKAVVLLGLVFLVLKSLKCTGLRLLWLHALLRSCLAVAPVIPFSVHLSPVKSRPEIKLKNDSLAVSFLMESVQHIAPCTCNCDCKCLSQTITKRKKKLRLRKVERKLLSSSDFYLFFIQYVADSIFRQHLQAEQVIICWKMKGLWRGDFAGGWECRSHWWRAGIESKASQGCKKRSRTCRLQAVETAQRAWSRRVSWEWRASCRI